MTNKTKYKDLCRIENSIPLFQQDWWLDATAGPENWDVVLFEENGEVKASLPYTIRKNYGLKFLEQPKLTQHLGPWMRISGETGAKRISTEKQFLSELIKGLPQFDFYGQNWHHSLQNWLPFYWSGFKQTTRYTYRLNNLNNHDKLWNELQGNIRREIKKATGRFALKVDMNGSFEDFISLSKKTFERQKKVLPYSIDFLQNLDNACTKQNCRKIILARDEQGSLHAGIYLVWNKESAYYLMGGGDPDLRTSGAASLCMWEAIKFASSVSKSFDFEGSMIEPIENFFRAFGATQTPYFYVSKTNSKVLQLKQFLATLRKAT